MKDSDHKPDICEAFTTIVGITPPENFGAPFIAAFSKLYKGEKEEVTAAAYTCSLFLSAILEGYPTAQLHTLVHHVQDNYTRFSFNCDMYEKIFKEMDSKDLQRVCLLQECNIPVERECNKEDIFEAFDFYTNR